MPRKKVITVPSDTSKKTAVSKKTDYIELKIPKFSKTSPLGFPLLVLGLLALSFFAGFQTAKVTYWEQKEKTLVAGTTTAGTNPTPTPAVYDVEEGHLPILGNKDAKVTIVEFSDLQCLFCRRFWKDTLPQIKKDYIDKGLVKFAYRQYPLPESMHPAARALSEASECANEQDKFWEFQDISFQKQDEKGEGTIAVSDEDITSWAQELGLAMDQFNSCFTEKKYADTIDKDMADGTKANVQSTPTFYINGQIVVGAYPYNTFKTIIDEQLNK